MGCDDRSTEYYFAPDLVRIRVGGTVSWRGGGTCRHLCTAYHPRFDRPRRIPADAAPWQGPDRRRGILTRRFPEAGIYDYYGLYEPFGQVGSVIVGDPDPTDQPGLAAPQASIPQAARRRLTDLNERTRRLLGG